MFNSSKNQIQAFRIQVDENNVSNVIFSFVFECYTFLVDGICDLDNTGRSPQ